MSRYSLLLVCLIWLCQCNSAVLSSHFRGALVQFRPVDPTDFNGTIEIRHRISWRRLSDLNDCSEEIIQRQILRGDYEQLTCDVGCSSILGDLQYYCTDYSVYEDWSAGERSYAVDLSKTSYFEAVYADRAWWHQISITDRTWEVRVKGNLTARPDTGRVNTSPITTFIPVLRLQNGCNHTITIPVTDADDDLIRCRWAQFSRKECTGECRSFPSTLNEVSCTLEYETTQNAESGYYVVALQIEDFGAFSSSTPMSSVPIKFIIHLFDSDKKCSDSPKLVPPTRPDKSCVAIPLDTGYSEEISAEVGDPEVSIQEIITASPLGLIHSHLSKLLNSRRWSINVTWTTLPKQAGQNLFCYQALDSNGLTSEMACSTLIVGVEAPKIISNSMTPVGRVLPNMTADWTVQFDKEFFRTPRTRYIEVYNGEGVLVWSVDAATSNDVSYPSDGIDRTLRFRPHLSLLQGMRYYVLLDSGIAVGPEFCKPESPPLQDPTLWTISVADIALPRVTFVEPLNYSSSNLTISWTINEEASTVCTLQTPISLVVIPCNNTLQLSNLSEGSHTLYVQATDLAGNVVTVNTSWTVDLAAPSVSLTLSPREVSNQTDSVFQFVCYNEAYCIFMCAIYEVRETPQYESCQSPVMAANLSNGNVYIFSVYATDSIGNMGSATNYTWKIDTTPPIIENITTNLLVECGDGSSPDAVGHPIAFDNEEAELTFVFMDIPVESCALIRQWTVIDAAGNTAVANQTIVFYNPEAPVPSTPEVLTIACGTVDEARSTLSNITISVTHPCDRPLMLYYMDSVNITHCGITFNRSWVIQDDCDMIASFTQTIRLLDQQFPISPENGLVNADLRQSLAWPQIRGATSYKIFVWESRYPQPSIPINTTTTQLFGPTFSYTPGTKINWKIEYVVKGNATLPSPIWRFETEPHPDLLVNAVTTSPFAFSGQSFLVSWTVVNRGNLSVITPGYTDSIYIGHSEKFSSSHLIKTVLEPGFIDAGESYSFEAAVILQNDDIGLFNVFVYTDSSGKVPNDLNRRNNIRMSNTPLHVHLTPPPNLRVENIVALSSVLSDTLVTVKWMVINDGLGITKADQWYDRIYLARNELPFLEASSVILYTTSHHGKLAVGSTYAELVSFQIPHALSGNFSFVIVTDVFNNVYENVFENDNYNSTQVEVVLHPPPDLVVSSLEVQSSIATGELLDVNYTVMNVGSGPSFERQWTDFVNFMSSSNGVGSTDYHRQYSELNVGEFYTVQVQFYISAAYESGIYNLSVYTDYYNQVFEESSDQNNMRWVQFVIEQRLPDLVTDFLNVTIESTKEGNNLNYSYAVLNIGAGSTIGAPWWDRLTLESSSLLKAYSNVICTEVQPGLEYKYEGAILLPSKFYGNISLNLVVDYENKVLEENKRNNAKQITNISVLPVLPDLSIVSSRIVNSSWKAIRNDDITVEWTVVNEGELVISALTWQDSIFINSLRSLEGSIHISDIPVELDGLEIGETYQQKANISLPVLLDYSIPYYIIIYVNSREDVDVDSRFSNNIQFIMTEVYPPPSPDLQVENVSASFFSSSRILSVKWSVRNVGNSMSENLVWTDQIILSSNISYVSLGLSEILGNVELNLKMQANQIYTRQVSHFIPSTLPGLFYVYVISDVFNRIVEVDGEDNNMLRSDDVVSINELPNVSTTFYVNASFSTLPTPFFSGQSFTLKYSVAFFGNIAAEVTSWVDVLYLSDRQTSNRSYYRENGKLLGHTLNVLKLEDGQIYAVVLNATLPHKVTGQKFLSLIVDVQNVLDIEVIGMVITNISIDIGLLPDITVAILSRNPHLISGQPGNIWYLVENTGESDAIGLWYEAIYLSWNSVLDPFDVRLTTVCSPVSRKLKINESYAQTVEVFIPYNLPTSYYYIIVVVDSTKNLSEEDESNNVAHGIVTVIQTVIGDVSILEVDLFPRDAMLDRSVNYTWRIHNYDILQANIYMCNSVFLSTDNQWDIFDISLESPVCFFNTINITGNESQSEMYFVKSTVIPIVSHSNYFGLVRIMTNVRDINLTNNMGSSSYVVTLNVQSLSLDTPTTLNLLSNSVKIFRVDGIEEQVSLVATLTSRQENVYHTLYLRYNLVPTETEYDAVSQFPLSSIQRALIRHTKLGAYFLRIESLENIIELAYSVDVIVSNSQLQIFYAAPVIAAPLGNVTIKLDGAILSYYYSVTLVGVTSSCDSKKLYWFNSESVYATFDISSMRLGNYSLHLINKGGQSAKLNNSFLIARGIPGKLHVSLEHQSNFIAGTPGDLLVRIQNIGNTDILSPCLVLVADKEISFRLMDDLEGTDNFKRISFLGLSSKGPAGIISPGTVTTVSFKLQPHQNMATQARIELRLSDNESAPHSFLGGKLMFQPKNIPSKAWEIIWSNFLSSVGTTQKSLQTRLSETASEFSLVEEKAYSIDKMISYQLQIASAMTLGYYVDVVEDLFDSFSGGFLPLNIIRTYSASIHKRRTMGPAGIGWIFKFLEMYIENITNNRINLWKERDYLVFTRDHESNSYSSGAELMAVTSEGVLYLDKSGLFTYLFDSESGRLDTIGGYFHNDTLKFTYDDNNKTQFIKQSGSFKRLNITYTGKGFIESIQVFSSKNEVENSCFYSYDETETYLMSVISGDNVVTYDYNEDGDLTSITNKDGSQTLVRYNENHFVAAIANLDTGSQLTSEISFEFSWNGHLDINIDPLNRTQRIGHDSNGRVVSVTQDNGLPLVAQEFLNSSRLLYGDEIIAEYRTEHRTTYSTDAKGVQIKFVRDDNEHLVLFEDGDGYEYSYSYDNNGLQTGFGYPDGTSAMLRYDHEGYLKSVVNQDQSEISFTYDDEDNLVSKIYPGSETYYEYNSRRVLVSASNENGKISIVYDNMNRPIEVQYLSTGHALYYGYNRRGQRTFLADNGGYNVSYTYDTQYRLHEVHQSSNNSAIARFEYDIGVLTKKTLGNGAYTIYNYDMKHRLVDVKNYFPNNTLSSSNKYEYDYKGRVVKSTDSDSQTRRYVYDSLGQVTGWTSSSGEHVHYTYDNRGNRLVTEGRGTTEACIVNEMNQYVQCNNGTDAFSYDLNGNMVQRSSPGRREIYEYNAEGRLISTQTLTNRCTYTYDVFGNLNTKNCSDGYYQYLIDPFGMFGSDIIAEFSDARSTYFVHSADVGLLAAINENGQNKYHYYEFNMDGATGKILDEEGEVLNVYMYDLFGSLTYSSEVVRNIFKYAAFLGVMTDSELPDTYMMRGRHYSAQLGRFSSINPIGINGRSTNFYTYAFNNPFIYKVPSGTVTLPIMGPTFSGFQKFTFGILERSYSAHSTEWVTLPGIVSTPGKVLLNNDGPLKNYGLRELNCYIKGQKSLVWGNLPGKYLLQPLLNVRKMKIWSTVMRNIYDEILSHYLTSLVKQNFNSFKEKTGNLNKDDANFNTVLYEDIEWIVPTVTNDITGPAGFGAARFVSPAAALNYKIRFANDTNSAAHNVTIKLALDDNLDIRSFQFGIFGLDDFVSSTIGRRSIQETINLTSSLGVFVRVNAGLNTVNKEAKWELLALDPLTGQAPSNRSIGLVDGSSIGYVTYSVFVDNAATNLAQIYAKATILFDNEEPNETPVIFNTIDEAHPTVNLEVDEDLLNAHVLAVNIHKEDSGSGVKEVDVYQIILDSDGYEQVVPVAISFRDNLIILPLCEEIEFKLFVSAVDNVGNRRPLEESIQDIVTFQFPLDLVMCPNNCSNNGNCTVFGNCQCSLGLYGDDCSRDTPPSEPPLLVIPLSVDGIQGRPISFKLSAVIPGQDSLDGLLVYVGDMPQGAVFNHGKQEQDQWIFTPPDLGRVELRLPPNYLGELILKVKAEAAGAERQKTLHINVSISEDTVPTSSVDNHTSTKDVSKVTPVAPIKDSFTESGLKPTQSSSLSVILSTVPPAVVFLLILITTIVLAVFIYRNRKCRRHNISRENEFEMQSTNTDVKEAETSM